jgi:uncharacterized protein YaaQ
MKLIVAIVPDNDTDTVNNSLTTASFRVTQVASTGGFLRRGHSTLLVGIEDEQLQDALAVLRKSLQASSEPEGKRGVVFVLKVDDYIHF